ncbi:MAG: 3'-5' exonuclease, partial [Candidatus Hydrogenedentota bacterium]
MTRWIEQDRPVVFFDLETTGTNRTTDRIVEIALVRIDVNGSERTFRSLVNPGIPIPEEVSLIHGITNEMVVTAPKFQDITGELITLTDNADLAGFNIARFDIDLLIAEFKRADSEFKMEGRRI